MQQKPPNQMASRDWLPTKVSQVGHEPYGYIIMNTILHTQDMVKSFQLSMGTFRIVGGTEFKLRHAEHLL